ncbi:MAG TPA: TetR/AcrR family transcriptional regulator [Micromonosporaceae bacterium]
MPKLWNETIEAHRRTVHDAILDATAALAAAHGPLAVTMSQIAEQTGIGRATLYKYFPDVEAILVAWHNREVGAHLDRLATARDRFDEVDRRLEAVLETYALIHFERTRRHRDGHHDVDLATLLHGHEHAAQVRQHIHDMIRDLLADAARAGRVRDDVAPDELARYCLYALRAAGGLPSESAVHRLVAVTLAGLAPGTP